MKLTCKLEAKLKAQTENLMEKLLPGVIPEKKHAVKQPAPLKPVLRTFAQR